MANILSVLTTGVTLNWNDGASWEDGIAPVSGSDTGEIRYSGDENNYVLFDSVPNGATCSSNKGRVENNYGTINESGRVEGGYSGLVNHNYSTVKLLKGYGSVNYNESGGIIEDTGSDGYVPYNLAGGTINLNRSTASGLYENWGLCINNNGTVNTNNGTITSNQCINNNGTVNTNNGTITSNQCIVTTNASGGIIGNKASGEVTTNEIGGIVNQFTGGTVPTNHGTVNIAEVGATFAGTNDGTVTVSSNHFSNPAAANTKLATTFKFNSVTITGTKRIGGGISGSSVANMF